MAKWVIFLQNILWKNWSKLLKSHVCLTHLSEYWEFGNDIWNCVSMATDTNCPQSIILLFHILGINPLIICFLDINFPVFPSPVEICCICLGTRAMSFFVVFYRISLLFMNFTNKQVRHNFLGMFMQNLLSLKMFKKAKKAR